MEIKEAFRNILNQLTSVIEQLSNCDLTKPVAAFSGSTIGQHFRHSIEFVQSIMSGYEKGFINYDGRKRELEIEADTQSILSAINEIESFIDECDISKELQLCVNYSPDNEDAVCIKTNLERELAYNIEHIVHHMALVKIGIREVCQHVKLPREFGIAISTIRYQDSLKA